jgi:hypothetical protein
MREHESRKKENETKTKQQIQILEIYNVIIFFLFILFVLGGGGLLNHLIPPFLLSFPPSSFPPRLLCVSCVFGKDPSRGYRHAASGRRRHAARIPDIGKARRSADPHLVRLLRVARNEIKEGETEKQKKEKSQKRRKRGKKRKMDGRRKGGTGHKGKGSNTSKLKRKKTREKEKGKNFEA